MTVPKRRRGSTGSRLNVLIWIGFYDERKALVGDVRTDDVTSDIGRTAQTQQDPACDETRVSGGALRRMWRWNQSYANSSPPETHGASTNLTGEWNRRRSVMDAEFAGDRKKPDACVSSDGTRPSRP